VLDMKAPQRREGQTTEAEVEVVEAAALFAAALLRRLPEPIRKSSPRSAALRGRATSPGACVHSVRLLR
jgi:hypothetical protein